MLRERSAGNGRNSGCSSTRLFSFGRLGIRPAEPALTSPIVCLTQVKW